MPLLRVCAAVQHRMQFPSHCSTKKDLGAGGVQPPLRCSSDEGIGALQVVGSQKQLEAKYAQATDTADQWYRRAELALQKGDDELAREALKRRKAYEVSPLASAQCVKCASEGALK